LVGSNLILSEIMKELKQTPEANGDRNYYYMPQYQEPLLDYISLLSEKCAPVTSLDMECKISVSSAIGTYATRYFQNELDKKDVEKFICDKNLIETIELMGYDIEKFWYLILFIYDYSYGYCVEGVKLGTPRRRITELIDTIIENIESFNGENEVPNFEREMQLTLSVKGKSKLEINDQDAIFYLSLLCSKELKKTKKSSGLDTLKFSEIEKQKANIKESPPPILICGSITSFFEIFSIINLP